MRKVFAVAASVAALVMVPLFLIVGVANAADFRGGNSTNVAKGEVIDSTLFIAGQSVEVAGEVNGDLYCAGNNVTVSGIVHGDVMCAGQTVNIRGTVDGDVRAAGQAVTVEAKVDGNVSIAGQTLAYGGGASARDVHIAGSSVALMAPVTRDADIAGEAVLIDSKVGRNVKASVANLRLGTGAAIGGDLEYTSRETVAKEKGATVTGATRHNVPTGDESGKEAANKFFASFKVFAMVAMFVTSLVLVALLPRWFYSLSERGMAQPLLSAASGLGVSVGGPIVVMLLAFTFIGLPLAVISLLAWLLILVLSGPVFSFYLGRLLLSRNTSNVFYYMLAGAAIMLVVSLIPILGGIVMLVASWLGAGMLVLEVIRRWPNPVYTLKTTRRKG